MPARPLMVPLAAAAIVISACDFGEVVVADPPPAPAAATVVLTVRGEEPEAAEPLGWQDGLIPGAPVTLVPEDTSRSGRWEGITSADGTVTFEDVPLGRYAARMTRPLTVDEFEGAERAIGGFAGMQMVSVGSAMVEIELLAMTSRRRAIVLSEYYDSNRYVAGVGSYSAGGFLEIYNNSDTTVVLDRLVVGVGFRLGYDYPSRPCSMFQHLRNDSEGLWARFFHQFPETGLKHLLRPGAVAVVATDAIDHGEYFEGEPNLSGAAYEFDGGPDNPLAFDLPDIGLEGYPGGHGLAFSSLGSVPFVSHPAHVQELPLDREPDSGREYVRFPADRIIEVISFMHMMSPLGHVPCPEAVHARFDRGFGEVTPEELYLLSSQRKVLLILPDGRPVLQDTDWTALDFEWANRTPGTVHSALEVR